MKTLHTSEFHSHLSEYLDSSPSTDEASAFESRLASLCIARLGEHWTEGWDFDVAQEYFSGRGCSILIQNLRIEWEGEWKFIRDQCSQVPRGALINFEVYDSIKGKLQYLGDQIVRRSIVDNGIYEEKE
jgi:hypothetical protein